MFYSVAELSSALSELGFSDVVGRPVLAGTVGFHAARHARVRCVDVQGGRAAFADVAARHRRQAGIQHHAHRRGGVVGRHDQIASPGFGHFADRQNGRARDLGDEVRDV